MGKKRAILSVSNKEGIVDFAKGLIAAGYDIISTGNTAKTLAESSVEHMHIEDITKFPECLDGRVKTLHPNIHGGILARRDLESHMQFLKEMNIDTIDLVCVNLYPFKQTILGEHSLEDAIENIDIGGPSMLRSAAKNHAAVAVVTEPADYSKILGELADGEISAKTRFELAAKAFAHTAAYDALIAEYLMEGLDSELLPNVLTYTMEKVQDLRYGENPHQEAALYKNILIPNYFEQLHGKELSFNNINDAHGAIALLAEFENGACVAVKHATPCGVSESDDVYEAYVKAYNCDPLAIYGGIVAVNKPVDKRSAEEMCKTFLEIVIAPEFTPEALEVFASKKNLRLLKLLDMPKSKLNQKFIHGGMLLQTADNQLTKGLLKHMTRLHPTQGETADMIFGYKVAKHLKSNAVAIVKDGKTLGLCGGQVSRISALKIAMHNATQNFGESELRGAVLASDGFFPFGDCVEMAAKAGICAIIQPGGSINDKLSIECADKFAISMSFAGIRHFNH